MELTTWKFYKGNVIELCNHIIAESIGTTNQSVHFISAHAIAEANKNSQLEKIFVNTKIICDSKPLASYLKLFQRDLQQIRGVDFMRKFLTLSPRYSNHLFIGGNDKVKRGIIDFISENQRSDLIITFELPGSINNWSEYIDDWNRIIAETEPDYIWVGLGAPKQFFIADAISKSSRLPAFSVGAAFDFISKAKKEAPSLVQRFGLEWAFRLITEPKRLWKRYLLGNLQFLWIIFGDLVTKLRMRKTS